MRRHLPSLDGLRGLAVLLVFIFHAAALFRSSDYSGYLLTFVAKFGWVGVDLFFVLSGFLISTILLSGDRVRYFRSFWRNRAVRILPAYYLFVVVSFFLLKLGLIPGETESEDVPFFYFLTFTSNIFTFFEGAHPAKPFSVLWSIDVEQHFYLAWPLVVFFVNKSRLVTLVCTVLLSTFFVRIYLYYLGFNDLSVYVMTLSHCDGLLVGSLYAIVQASPGKKVSRTLKRFVLMYCCLFAIGVSFTDIATAIQSLKYTAVPLVCAWLMHGVLTSAILRRGGEFYPLRLLGKYSYSFYLWHFTILIILDGLLSTSKVTSNFGGEVVASILISLLAFLVTFFVCKITWILVEAPMSKFKYRSP